MEHGHASDVRHILSSLAVQDDKAAANSCLQTALSCWRQH